MSCGCNSSPCNCQPRPSVCCTPTTESVTYTFENANLVGIGVFDNDTDYLVQFRGIVSDSAALTVTLNATDNTIVFTFDPAALVADIPDATTVQRGILETSTNAEAQAKAAQDKILTPSNLAALGSSTTFAGLVELATDAETIAGVSTTLAVTPAGLAAVGQTYSTVTFADAATRGGTVPSFAGQFGGQLDTQTAFIAGSTTVGDWYPILTLGSVNEVTDATTVNLNSSTLSFVGLGEVIFNTAEFTQFDAASSFYGSTTTFGILAGAPQTVDFANVVWQIGGADIAAASVVTTGATAIPSSRLLNTFASTANVQTGYTTFGNPATLRTCDTATVTLQQLAQIVGTLIGDLKVPLIPAT